MTSTWVPSLPVIDLPHHIDRRFLEAEYARIPEFIASAEAVRERESSNSNGSYFHIMAGQWKALASLHYVFGQKSHQVLYAGRNWLEEELAAIDLGHPLTTKETLDVFFAAIALNNLSCAHFLASAPGDILGFDDDPDDPLALVATAAFAIIRQEKSELDSILDPLREILLEAKSEGSADPKVLAYFDLIAAIDAKNEHDFNTAIRGWCHLRGEEFASEESDPLDIIDWIGLGLVRLARPVSSSLKLSHVYIPLELLNQVKGANVRK